MAENKKMVPKSKPNDLFQGVFGNLDWLETIIVLIIILSIISFIVGLIPNLDLKTINFYGISISKIFSVLGQWNGILKFLSFFFSGIFFVGIICLSFLMSKIISLQKAKLYPSGELEISKIKEEEFNPLKDRWHKILEKSNSDNESDWRLAIMEADIILDELLEKLQLPGDTMGDKLKAVEKSDFTTIDLAWEAHKVRNMIAHEGSNFLLNRREVSRIISLYEAVFKEFYLI